MSGPWRSSLGLWASALLATGYAASPDVFLAGHAGPYRVRVRVETPGVIPGLAGVTIAVSPPSGLRRVTAQPVVWDAGPGGAPPPDVARAVRGSPGVYRTRLWLMTSGSYGVRVTVSGGLGEGYTFVPVTAAAYRRLGMPLPLALTLGALAAFLVAGALTMVRAAAGEALLDPGESIDPRGRRRARAVTVGATLIVALALLGGWWWWRATDRFFTSRLYRPPPATASLTDPRTARLALVIDEPGWPVRGRPLAAEAGKMIHLFLVREAGSTGFAHLHPARTGPRTFEGVVPALPGGRYRVYGELVHVTGRAETVTASVDLPAPPVRAGPRAADPDDAWWAEDRDTPCEPPLPVPCRRLPGGAVLVWDRAPGPIPAKREVNLDFAVRDALGAPVALAPYLGTAGHAAVLRDDGAGFMHLRPFGNFPETAFARFATADRDPASTARAPDLHADDETALRTGRITFPCVFPEPGRYRVWVTVRRGDDLLTAAFDAEVTGEAPGATP